jgi:2-hydroxychromene-2-carboxylate isomerase
MAEQFENLGGASNTDPPALGRWAASRWLSHLASPRRLERQRRRVEKQRAKNGLPHVVEYFHYVEDGYSHMAAQVLEALLQRYDIELVCHLVGTPPGDNAPEPEMLRGLSRYDAFHVAPEYGLQFPEHQLPPEPALLQMAASILSAQDTVGFVACAAAVGQALWSDDAVELERLAALHGRAADAEVERKLAVGNARRDELGHYSGAMLYYGSEWYWGVDRLYHLENRLQELGADARVGEPLLYPRPKIEAGPLQDSDTLTLEFFPTLRSPYTAIVFDRVIRLAQDTRINLVVRPVLPMIMRGVPTTVVKGKYIYSDTAREARAAGVPFGKIYDSIGEPVRRAYSLYPWAFEQGMGNEFLSAFLGSVFADRVNANNDRGMRRVVEQAGLNWSEACRVIGRPGWEDMVETNRLTLYQAGIWGTPSFRILDKGGEEVLALWGQDRLWLIAREIQRQLAR